VDVVNGHQLTSSMVKWSRAILQCGEAVKRSSSNKSDGQNFLTQS